MKTKLYFYSLLSALCFSAAAQTVQPGYTNAVVFTTTNNVLYANGARIWREGETNSGGALTNVTAEWIAPGSITNATSSTFGHGAGLVRYDTNYLYLSVATNAWGRVELVKTNW